MDYQSVLSAVRPRQAARFTGCSRACETLEGTLGNDPFKNQISVSFRLCVTLFWYCVLLKDSNPIRRAGLPVFCANSIFLMPIPR